MRHDQSCAVLDQMRYTPVSGLIRESAYWALDRDRSSMEEKCRDVALVNRMKLLGNKKTIGARPGISLASMWHDGSPWM